MAATKPPPFVKPEKGKLIDLKPGQQLDPDYQQRAQASWQKTLDSGQALVMTPQAIGARLAKAGPQARARWGLGPNGEPLAYDDPRRHGIWPVKPKPPKKRKQG